MARIADALSSAAERMPASEIDKTTVHAAELVTDAAERTRNG
jgi:hypothetical protein